MLHIHMYIATVEVPACTGKSTLLYLLFVPFYVCVFMLLFVLLLSCSCCLLIRRIFENEIIKEFLKFGR